MPAVHGSPSPSSSTSWLRKDFGRNGPLFVLIQNSRQSLFIWLKNLIELRCNISELLCTAPTKYQDQVLTSAHAWSRS
jgi:hypothetical protein